MGHVLSVGINRLYLLCYYSYSATCTKHQLQEFRILLHQLYIYDIIVMCIIRLVFQVKLLPSTLTFHIFDTSHTFYFIVYSSTLNVNICHQNSLPASNKRQSLVSFSGWVKNCLKEKCLGHSSRQYSSQLIGLVMNPYQSLSYIRSFIKHLKILTFVIPGIQMVKHKPVPQLVMY